MRVPFPIPLMVGLSAVQMVLCVRSGHLFFASFWAILGALNTAAWSRWRKLQ